MHLRTTQRDTLDTEVRRHLEWLSFNWKTYFSSSSSSTWSESPTWWSSSSWDHRWHEWHSHGWQDKEWRDQQQPRQRQSHAHTSTRRLVRGRQTEKVSVVVKFTWIRTPCVVFAYFYDFFFLAVSRPDSGNCHELDGLCTDNTSPYAHTRTFFSLRTLARQMWLHVWLKGLTVLFCVPQKSFHLWSCLCWMFLRPVSSFLLVAYCLTDATDWNQIKPVRTLRSGMDRLAIWPIRSQTHASECQKCYPERGAPRCDRRKIHQQLRWILRWMSSLSIHLMQIWKIIFCRSCALNFENSKIDIFPSQRLIF